jgi:hypothetical protein
MQTAQGPLTRHLGPYFTIADQIAASLSEPIRLGIHDAGAKLAGGHLRSQLCYRVWASNRPLDDPENMAIMRNSNSMDTALLVRDLVPLLQAYRTARAGHDAEQRLTLADAILQGMSADPELFLTRLDLLAPCTMLEELFIQTGSDGRAEYTPMGHAHVALLGHYGELLADVAASLAEDAPSFAPSHGAYSPYGVAYGFVADVLSNIALDTLVSQPSRGLSLEDMFVSRGSLDDKLARAQGWAKLPVRAGEREHFHHSREFADQCFARTVDALALRTARTETPNASAGPDARLFVVPESRDRTTLSEGFLPPGVVNADEHCLMSDVARALAGAGTAIPGPQILIDRNEARFLASVESEGKWFAVSKVLVSLIMSQGRDALITDVPPSVIDVLRLTCPGLIVLPPDVRD